MAAQEIEYVELYASDGDTAVDYFVSSFDFTKVAESISRERRSVLLAQGPVRLIVTAGSAVTEFVEQHGDGIADICFGCDDVAATFTTAVTAGAAVLNPEPGRPTVSGFGGTRHTLVSRAGKPDLPAGWSWVPAQAAPGGQILLLDHVAVCVAGGTLASWADFYIDGFGLGPYSSERTEVGDQAMNSTVVRSPSGGVTFTILEPDTGKNPGQLDAFLSRNGGPGVQHLAFGVADIISAVGEFGRQGVEFLSTPPTYYDMLAERLPEIRAEIASLRDVSVLADRDEWGYLLQLFTRSPYERNTLFYELVQRRGARGFGSANIKALYEAVERDRLATG
jgi:4-hydroxymandelate synthase